jgi:stalled ribosome rescue protein Dom34
VSYSERPSVRGLAEVIDDGRPRGVVAISSERVRSFDWRFGELEELAARELELLEPAWRERKAPQMRDPASGHAVSSAGKDQHGQRVDEQRRRFLKEAAHEIEKALDDDAAREILCIGEAGLCEDFVGAWPGNAPRVIVDAADVITEPASAIGERATAKITAADAERDRDLVDRAIDGAAAGGHGALGVAETAQALAVGQVERLLVDPDRRLSADALGDGIRAEVEAATSLPADPLDEWFAQIAIRTSAAITAIRDEPAERLAEHGGVAAILRYV